MKRNVLLFGTLALTVICCITAAGCVSVSEADTASGSVNYADMDNWMFFPKTHSYDVDVIYFYPTVFASDATVTNSRIDDSEMRKEAKDVYRHQGSAFETVGDVYVPYYRQFTGQFLMNATDILSSNDTDFTTVLSLAKNDIFDALDYYFENANEKRPYILAGHSQGTMMLKSVLSEYMALHPEYYKNMIAAYGLGIAIPQSFIEENPHLKAAAAADDTGVIVSWNSEVAGNPAETGLFKNPDAIVINPLNWKTDSTYAGIEENHGSFVRFENGSYGVGPGVADAKIENGVVIVSKDSPDTAAKTLSAGDVEMIEQMAGPYTRHMDDYDYFYVNIRENAAIRAAAFLQAASGK
ncbi:MAG TPA: DUF3089 domain-containing protein [Methanocorpusculum sp.]|nr:DUF3089 domain-containing protein [Methanocorpusculum sp.]